jgi:hypothetical protein
MVKSILIAILVSAFNFIFAQTVFINEVHYDNSGADINEGFEIAAEAGTSLFGWRILLYNGSNSETYASIVIPNMFPIPNQSNGFGFLTIPYDGIQNGAPDGFALVTPSDSVVQFLSYEGVITATNGAAAGLTSTDIGVMETSATPITKSLQLTGYGNDYNDFSWQPPSTSSFGELNFGQTFGSGQAPDTYDVTNFNIVSNTEIRIAFSEKLSVPLVGFNILSSSLSNVSESVVADTILVLTFDPFTLGTSQNIEISKDLENINGELLSKNISETFLFNNSKPPLVISEIMYNNASTNTIQDKLEFIEVYNHSNIAIELGGFEFSAGVEYKFPEGASLAPKAFYIICENATEFEKAFGRTDVYEWSGSLNNSGETISIINTEKALIDTVYYRDSGAWPTQADGDGSSLEIIDPSSDNTAASNWRAAKGFGGIYDNEISYASPFALESVVVAPLNITNFEAINNTEIKITFSSAIEPSSINLSLISGLEESSSITLKSDSILIISLQSPLSIGKEYKVRIDKSFVADTNGLALSKDYLKTFIFNNSTPKLIISEIMYNLPGDDTGLEFIELYNQENDTIDVSGFYFQNGVEYVFPVGSKIGPHQFYLLGEDGPLLSNVFSAPFLSWTAQNLNNSGELISIHNASHIEIDRVEYDDASPWPNDADGQGSSLEIINPELQNNNAKNWRPSAYYAVTIGKEEIFASPGALEISTNSVFYFTSDSLTFFEGEIGSIQVHLKHAEKLNTRADIVINVASAEENKDFTLLTKTVRYEGTETVFDIRFEINKDYIKENTEYFELKLESAKHALISTTNGSAKIIIKDLDQGSANICINEINRQATSPSPGGSDAQFIELANVDFYSENLERYNLMVESQDTSIIIDLKNYFRIEPNKFIAIWLDDNPLYDEIKNTLLFDQEITISLIKGNVLVDEVRVPAHTTTEVYARKYDCDSEFEKRNNATPNGSNNPNGVTEKSNLKKIIIYPNPVQDYISFSRTGNYTIYNSIGVAVKEITHAAHANVSDLPQGVYFVKAESGENGRFVK